MFIMPMLFNFESHLPEDRDARPRPVNRPFRSLVYIAPLDVALDQPWHRAGEMAKQYRREGIEASMS
jgi:hypothetical protein